MPPEVDHYSTEEDIMYYKLVKDNMIHVCGSAVNGCLDSNGNCKRGYRSRVPTESTTLDANGYPKYKRPAERDLRVVPHNRELLLARLGRAHKCGVCRDELYSVILVQVFVQRQSQSKRYLSRNYGQYIEER